MAKEPTKSKLKGIKPTTAAPDKPKILIFGKPGVGKTWTSLDFPNCYYIDTEGGASRGHYTEKLDKSGGCYMGIDQGSLDFCTVIGQVQALATEVHPYKTLVIDSLSKLFALAIAGEAERLEKEGKVNAYGADKKPAVAQIRRLVMWLMRLDMNVVLICHEKAEWGSDAKGDRVEIGATFDCWDKLEYELDLCLHIFKQGADRKARVRKTRLLEFEGAMVFPWSFPEFAKRYGEAIIAKEVKRIELATPEQVAELKDLLSKIRLPEGAFDKWLTAANAGSIEEIDTTKIDGMINKLKGSLQ